MTLSASQNAPAAASNDLLDDLLFALDHAGLKPDEEQTADALWLAVQIRRASGATVLGSSDALGETEEYDAERALNDKRSAVAAVSGTFDVEAPISQPTASERQTPPILQDPLPPRYLLKTRPGLNSTLPFRTPAGTALPSQTVLSRALQNLRRRVPSCNEREVDIEATVDQIAGEGLWFPVMRPASVRWLSAVLVVDASSSMAIWQQTAVELRGMMERSGIFRNVRSWELCAEKGEAFLQAFRPSGEIAGKESTRSPVAAPRHSPRELFDANGQRLILVLSDAVGPGWRDGTMIRVLREWSERHVVALAQTLPSRLWPGTALHSGEEAFFQAPLPGAPSNGWRTHFPDLLPDESLPLSLSLPVVQLSQEHLRAFAACIRGQSNAWCGGYALPLAPANAMTPPAKMLESPFDAASSVKRFLDTASPPARQLAGYLSAAPALTLPVMRLVQQVMLPDSTQADLAEVYLSGLLQRQQGQEQISAAQAEYVFRNGVRPLLLQTISGSGALGVLRRVSAHINVWTGAANDFVAFLTAVPQRQTGAELPEGFAEVAREVLQRVGIMPDSAPATDPVPSPETPRQEATLEDLPLTEDAHDTEEASPSISGGRISLDTIREANRAMLGKTNRTVLFAQVNSDEYLDPDMPLAQSELVPSLLSLLSVMDNMQPALFLTSVREQLTVTSFPEFLDKFQPGFYYRILVSGVQELDDSASDDIEAGDPDADAWRTVSAPRVEFSLTGGMGWKKVRITQHHPYLRGLAQFSTREHRPNAPFRMNVSAVPPAANVKRSPDLLLELTLRTVARMPKSGDSTSSEDTIHALKAYRDALERFLIDMETAIPLFPAVRYMPERSGGSQLDADRLALEFGSEIEFAITERDSEASPRLPQFLALSAIPNADAMPDETSNAHRTVFHELFLGAFSKAMHDFFLVVTPLFETILGVYLLFNEFPSDIRLPQNMKPELVIANAALPTLMQTHQEELRQYFAMTCNQANNLFRDAVSFVIVPDVVPFRLRRPSTLLTKATNIIRDSYLDMPVAVQQTDNDALNLIAYSEEIIPLMEWGAKFGFQVLFSPEQRLLPGLMRNAFAELHNDYAIEEVVMEEWADCAVMCVPDFVIIPPDGRLSAGTIASDGSSVGIDVPQIIVRACYVAAGRLMANDVPWYIQRQTMLAKQDPSRIRNDLPGVGIDLAINMYMGKTCLPPGFALNHDSVRELYSRDGSFLVFALRPTQLPSQPPFIAAARTLRRLEDGHGRFRYRPMHLFRQEVYLSRLLGAAFALSYGGSWPADDAEAETALREVLHSIVTWTDWYAPDRLINSFPSKLRAGDEFYVGRKVGNTFEVILGYDQGLTAPIQIQF